MAKLDGADYKSTFTYNIEYCELWACQNRLESRLPSLKTKNWTTTTEIYSNSNSRGIKLSVS